jgi:hypothetical protein
MFRNKMYVNNSHPEDDVEEGIQNIMFSGLPAEH